HRKLKKKYMPCQETVEWIVGGGVVVFVLMYLYKRSCNNFSYDLSTPPDITIPQGPRNQPARSCLKKTGGDTKKTVRWKDDDNGDLCAVKEIPARKNKTKS
ncbi:MAG TPA: hypothetical protein VI521_02510, partial [Candidatus Babeliales bacterium]|nr:hypothetical protein [Candidatus Babeliales bacterium]